MNEYHDVEVTIATLGCLEIHSTERRLTVPCQPHGSTAVQQNNSTIIGQRLKFKG